MIEHTGDSDDVDVIIIHQFFKLIAFLDSHVIPKCDLTEDSVTTDRRRVRQVHFNRAVGCVFDCDASDVHFVAVSLCNPAIVFDTRHDADHIDRFSTIDVNNRFDGLELHNRSLTLLAARRVRLSYLIENVRDVNARSLIWNQLHSRAHTQPHLKVRVKIFKPLHRNPRMSKISVR